MTRVTRLAAEWSIADVTAARLALSDLEVLSRFRDQEDVQVAADVDDGHCWVSWPAVKTSVTYCLLAVRKAELYRQDDGEWYRLGSYLASPSRPPEVAQFVPLYRALLPARAEWVEPSGSIRKVRLALEVDDRPKPTTALLAHVSDVLTWAEVVPTSRLRAIEAALYGERVLLIGRMLPGVAGERWWGERVLCPLGRRPEPDLSEAFLASAIGLGGGERAILRAGEGEISTEILGADAFRPLSRGGLRRGMSEGGL